MRAGKILWVALMLPALASAVSPLLVVAGTVITPIITNLLHLDDLLASAGGGAFIAALNNLTGICTVPAGVQLNGMISLAYLGALAAFFFLLFLHLAERFLFGASRVPLLAKVEDVFVTFLIVAAFHLLFSLVGGVDYYFLKASIEYVDKGIAILTDSYLKLVFANFVFATLFNLDVPLIQRGGMIFASVNLGFVSKPLTDSVMLLANMMQTSLTEWVVRRITLCLTPSLVILYLFPIGALLRGLYFTRGAGSAMLALAFSLFFFYPFLNFISYKIFEVGESFMDVNLVSPTAKELADMAKYITITAGVVWGLAYFLNYGVNLIKELGDAVGLSISPGITSVLSLPTRAVSFIYYLSLIVFLVGLVMGHIPLLFRDLFTFVVSYGVVLPAINIYLTLVLAIELSKVFGMQVDLSAFMRLI